MSTQSNSTTGGSPGAAGGGARTDGAPRLIPRIRSPAETRLSQRHGVRRALSGGKRTRDEFVSCEHTLAEGEGDPLRAMRRLARATGRQLPRIGSPPPAGLPPAFTPLHANGAPAPGSASRWLSAELRRLFALVGLPLPPDLMKLSSHGLRRGGATEELEAGVQRADVMKGGRWTSEGGFAPYDARGTTLATSVSRTLAASRQ